MKKYSMDEIEKMLSNIVGTWEASLVTDAPEKFWRVLPMDDMHMRLKDQEANAIFVTAAPLIASQLLTENATLKKQVGKMRDCLLLFFKSFNPDGVTPEEVRQKEIDFNEFLLDAKKILAEIKRIGGE